MNRGEKFMSEAPGTNTWKLMATIMAEYLGKVIIAKRTDHQDFPHAAFLEAKEFFNLAAEGFHEDISIQNFPRNITAYSLALSAVYTADDSISEEQANIAVNNYRLVLGELYSTHEFSSEELVNFEALKIVFTNLADSESSEFLKILASSQVVS